MKLNRLIHNDGVRLLTLTLLTLVVGVVFYKYAEGLSWLDAALFTVVTLTTVGYGDITPSTSISKIFTIIYIFVGITIIFAFINHLTQRTREAGFIKQFFSEPDNKKKKQ